MSQARRTQFWLIKRLLCRLGRLVERSTVLAYRVFISVSHEKWEEGLLDSSLVSLITFGGYLTGEFSATIKKGGFLGSGWSRHKVQRSPWSVILIMWYYRKCMGKSRFSKNWSRTSLHSSFSELLLWTGKLLFSNRKHQMREIRKK